MVYRLVRNMAAARGKTGRPFKNHAHRLSVIFFGRMLDTVMENIFLIEGFKEIQISRMNRHTIPQLFQAVGSFSTFATLPPFFAERAPAGENKGDSRRLIARKPVSSSRYSCKYNPRRNVCVRKAIPFLGGAFVDYRYYPLIRKQPGKTV